MNDQSNMLTALLRAIAKDDKAAFNRFHKIYFTRFKRFAFSLLKQEEWAEEIASDLFVTIWLKRNLLTNVEDPNNYLYRALKNKCLNAMKKDSKWKIVQITEQNEVIQATVANPLQRLENKELIQFMDAIISTLPEQRRLIFRLVKEDGMKQKDVASLLDISVRTVESHMYKAIKYLAEKVEVYLEKSPHPTVTNKREYLFSLFL